MLTAMWSITLELAPWLLLGTAIAAALHVLLPEGFIRRHLRGRYSVARAVALGVPLPLCSCGVIPAGLGLRRDGASRGATVGFLISTPQTGVDSILVSGSFLGWPFAVFKLLSAALTGLVGGWLVERAGGPDETADEAPESASSAAVASHGLRAAFDHGSDILRSIWRWLVFGIVVSAAIETLVPETFFASLADRGAWLPMLAALAVSLPLYVCATASVPIAASLVAAGLPGGAALVFLMAGPATNVATVGAIGRGLGRRVLGIYLGTIIGGSLLAGWLFDSVLAIKGTAAAHDHGDATWWAVSSAVVMLATIAWLALDDVRRWIAKSRPDGDGPSLEVDVAGMTCDNCASRLERALRSVDGVSSATVALDPGHVTIRGTAPEADVLDAVERAGFRVV